MRVQELRNRTQGRHSMKKRIVSSVEVKDAGKAKGDAKTKAK